MRVRKPVREEKKKISAAGLDWKEWNVLASITNGILVVHKTTGERKVVPK